MAVVLVNPADVQISDQSVKLRFPVVRFTGTLFNLAALLSGSATVSPNGNIADVFQFNLPKFPRQPKFYEISYKYKGSAIVDNSVTPNLDPKIYLHAESIKSESTARITYDGTGALEDWILKGQKVYRSQDSLEKIQIPAIGFYYSVDMASFGVSTIYAPSVLGTHVVQLYLGLSIHGHY